MSHVSSPPFSMVFDLLCYLVSFVNACGLRRIQPGPMAVSGDRKSLNRQLTRVRLRFYFICVSSWNKKKSISFVHLYFYRRDSNLKRHIFVVICRLYCWRFLFLLNSEWLFGNLSYNYYTSYKFNLKVECFIKSCVVCVCV